MYSVVGTATNSCKATTSFTQNVSACTNISGVVASNNPVLISPNPFYNTFTIYSEATIQNFDIYNVQGKKIRSIQIANDKTQVNLSEENAGIYFIRSADGTIVKKIVKE
jgi:hypothetical protein